MSKPDLTDVITHRSAWRDAIAKVRDDTDDDDGTGYYSHELAVFDRTFDFWEKIINSGGVGEDGEPAA